MNDPKLPKHLLCHSPWDQKSMPIWPASTFSIRRNIARHPFSSKLSPGQKQATQELILNALLNCPHLEEPTFFQLKDLSLCEKQYLFEHYFIPEILHEEVDQQGVVIDKSGFFLAGIHFDDHLVLNMIDSKTSWHRTTEKLYLIEQHLGKSLEFAFSPKFGYLTSNPKHCGNSLQIHAYLHLPILLQTDSEKDPLYFEKEDYVSVGQMNPPAQEELGAFYGDLVILSNKYSLGISEDHLLRGLYASANKLINLESQLRSELKLKENAEFKDLVSRSFGILKHSYQMPTEDALSALSFIKLGIDLGWVEGLLDHEINDIFFKCRRGHLLVEENTGDDFSKDDLLHKRAGYIHQQLKNATLKI